MRALSRDEVIGVLAAQAPDLHDALRKAKQDGVTHLILDGKLFSTDRLASRPPASQANRSTPGTPGSTAKPVATSKP
jgi:hypothetical protein